MKRRLDVLDGLRGFAIVLVFLNHIDSFYIAEAVPSFIRPFVQFLFTSGNLGVTFFFILSGFLMGYLYANPIPGEFIERRYARIFPPFIVMAFCMWIFRLFPATPLFLRILLMLGAASVARLIWIYVVERFHKGSALIKVFLFLQLCVAAWYGFFIMRRPPIWLDSLPFLVKEGTIFATNATLTLPLGNYIPLLDGVYWSLAPEMIFYLLYPYIFSPTVSALQKKSKMIVGFFIISLFPLFFGLSLLFKHSQGLTMLFIEYFIYFCGGIGIAQIIRKQTQKAVLKRVSVFINPLTFIILLFFAYTVLGRVSGVSTALVRLFLVLPFGYVVYLLLQEETPLSRLFQHKVFLFLGTISYSMYIGHTAIVDGMHLLLKPTNLLTNILFLIMTATVFMGVAYALHLIIEKPYFQFKPTKKTNEHTTLQNKYSYVVLLLGIVFIYFTSYTSQFNFFSLQKKYPNSIPSTITITDTPYSFSFISQENNMGVILVHLTNSVENIKIRSKAANPFIQQRFQIRMKEQGEQNWYANQDTAPAEIGNSASYPFGFPPIAKSKGKTYIVEMAMKDIDYRSSVLFNKDEYPLITVHQIPKKELLVNPLKLASHIGDKLTTAFSNPEAQLVAACISPFFLLLFLL